MTDSLEKCRADALAIYDAAIRAVDPSTAVRRAVAGLPSLDYVWIIAVGKAAGTMATAAVDQLASMGSRLRGGLVVDTHRDAPADLPIERIEGDHPDPGARSEAAAASLGRLVSKIGPTDRVLVLLSGGATSLIGAPAEGVDRADYLAVAAAAWRAGLPIGDLNRIRKRFSRWGAGRLAAAIPAAAIHLLAISDVPNDDLTALGSGPCTADPIPAGVTRRVLEQLGLPAPVRSRLARWLESPNGALPPADHPGFGRVASRVVGSNRVAVAAAVDRARALGYRTTAVEPALDGEAAGAGGSLAERLLRLEAPAALIAGGETTVRLGPAPGLGGRCQELALAAARRLADGPGETVLLAAGTDGRDGPTDAAGAVVDRTTWRRIIERGLDPERHLEGHDAYPALDAAGALLRTGPTGTNVADLVVGLTA